MARKARSQSPSRTQLLEALDEFLHRLLSPVGRAGLDAVVERLLKLRHDRLARQEALAVAMVHAFSEVYWREYCIKKSPADPEDRKKATGRVRLQNPHLDGRDLQDAIQLALDHDFEPYNSRLRARAAKWLPLEGRGVPPSVAAVLSTQWAQAFLDSVKFIEPHYGDNGRTPRSFNDARAKAFDVVWTALPPTFASRSTIERVSGLISNRRLVQTEKSRVKNAQVLFEDLELGLPSIGADVIGLVTELLKLPSDMRREIVRPLFGTKDLADLASSISASEQRILSLDSWLEDRGKPNGLLMLWDGSPADQDDL